MANFEFVSGSRGARRAFALTVGIREGYGQDARTHTIEEVIATCLEWMKERAASGQSFLTGTLSAPGEVVYAWPEGPGAAGGGHEPVITFSGEVSPLYGGNLTNEEVEAMLCELASRLGSALGQARIYVAWCDEVWILQAEQTVTPTGETV